MNENGVLRWKNLHYKSKFSKSHSILFHRFPNKPQRDGDGEGRGPARAQRKEGVGSGLVWWGVDLPPPTVSLSLEREGGGRRGPSQSITGGVTAATSSSSAATTPPSKKDKARTSHSQPAHVSIM
jgi:hypothetical protein